MIAVAVEVDDLGVVDFIEGLILSCAEARGS
jgi:hypothetical protein